MTASNDLEPILDAWLGAGHDVLPDRSIHAVLATVQKTSQRGAWRAPWRTPTVNGNSRLALMAGAAVFVVVVGGLVYLGGSRAPSVSLGVSPAPSPTPIPSATLVPSPTPTATLSPSPTRTAAPSLEAVEWITYHSDRYGFDIGYPDDWNVGQTAQRDWTFEADATNALSPATEDFTSPDGQVRLSAWSVALEPASIDALGKSDGLERWVEAYCQKTGNTDCSGIHDRAVPLCLERRDCHPGLLVPFQDDVQAFFTGGIYDADRMNVVAVWRGESDPAVAPYGGSQRLFEAFLSTMAVWPEATPLRERVPASPPTALPLPTASPSPIATSDWVPFTSARYGFTMSYPADWSIEPSTRAWTLGVDKRDWLTPAADTFLAPGHAVRFSVFAAPMPGGRTGDWIESYIGGPNPCPPTRVYIGPTTVDGHPATFRADPDIAGCGGTFAFVPVGDQMYVFAVWLPGYEPLLTAFLSTVRFDS